MRQDGESGRQGENVRWGEEAARQRATVAEGLRRDPGIGIAAPVTGERRLVAAILGDALHEILRTPEIASRQDLRKAEQSRGEARAWMESDDRISPFSFLTVCDVLGLDPDYVRSRVARRLRARHVRRDARRAGGGRPLPRVLRAR